MLLETWPDLSPQQPQQPPKGPLRLPLSLSTLLHSAASDSFSRQSGHMAPPPMLPTTQGAHPPSPHQPWGLTATSHPSLPHRSHAGTPGLLHKQSKHLPSHPKHWPCSLPRTLEWLTCPLPRGFCPSVPIPASDSTPVHPSGPSPCFPPECTSLLTYTQRSRLRSHHRATQTLRHRRGDDRPTLEPVTFSMGQAQL